MGMKSCCSVCITIGIPAQYWVTLLLGSAVFLFGPEELVHQVCMCLVYVCMVYRYMIVHDAHRIRADVLSVACMYMDCLHACQGHLSQSSGFGSHAHTCVHDVVHLLLIAHGAAAAWAAQVMLFTIKQR